MSLADFEFQGQTIHPATNCFQPSDVSSRLLWTIKEQPIGQCWAFEMQPITIRQLWTLVNGLLGGFGQLRAIGNFRDLLHNDYTSHEKL